MEYITKKGKIILPEYGRNIQQMVEHALTIEDREERTRCAKTIIASMGNLFPYLRDVSDFKHKLWDHLAIMSDFRLDIDYPYEVVNDANVRTAPEKVPYPSARIRYRHYGQFLQQAIDRVNDYPEGEKRDVLVRMIANQMKKSYMSWNKDNVDDRKIFDDLREMSDGKVDVPPETMKLTERRDFPQQPQQRRNNNNNHKRKKQQQ